MFETLWLVFPLVALVALFVAPTRKRLIAPLILLGIAFALALAANASDFRDADGWIDCWPSCSGVQTATGVGLVYVPVAGLFLAAATIIVALVRRRR